MIDQTNSSSRVMLSHYTNCFNCKAKDSATITKTSKRRFKICSGCHIAVYCSKDCQKKDWKKHKKICRKNADSDAPQERSAVSAFRKENRLRNSKTEIKTHEECRLVVKTNIDRFKKINKVWSQEFIRTRKDHNPKMKAELREIYKEHKTIIETIIMVEKKQLSYDYDKRMSSLGILDAIPQDLVEERVNDGENIMRRFSKLWDRIEQALSVYQIENERFVGGRNFLENLKHSLSDINFSR